MYDYLIYGAIAFIFFIFLIYVYTKDNEVNRKFFLYEKAIEELNKKLYDIEKELGSINNISKDNLKEYIDEVIEDNLQKITQFILSSRKEEEKRFENIENSIENKLISIEEKIKNFTVVPESYQTNEKKIVSLYNKGLSVNEIARNLRIGIGEVELVLKIEGIK